MTDEIIDLTGDGGILKKIILEGTGVEKPMNGCKISLHYIGKCLDGSIFDSSFERFEPFEFVLGSGSVIKALDIGAGSMKNGEKCELTCIPKYTENLPNVPKDSNLIFEVEMLGWKGEDVSPDKTGEIEKFILKRSERKRTPNDGAHVKIHLIGKYDDKIFEERDSEFNVGEGSEDNIIEGIEIALPKVCVGETSRLIIKPKYAFGSKGNELFNIPPNATVEYTITLLHCEKAIDEWKLDRDESKEQAKLFKDKGTDYFTKEKYPLAIKMYNKSNNYLSSWDDAESQQIKLAIHNNIALCYQKQSNFYEAKTACNTALEIDPNNVKALYRRGQCFFAINDIELALADFEKVHKIEPENKAAINQIVLCKQKNLEFQQAEKKLYANMFSKFAAADKQKETEDLEAQPDVLSSCGEWTEEDAIREADMAFERDHNIVMIDSTH